MPRSKLSASEQVVKRHQQAEEAAHKHKKKMVTMAVKHCPGCVAGVWQQLQSMGYHERYIMEEAEKGDAVENATKKKDALVETEPPRDGTDFTPVEPVKGKARYMRDLDVSIIRDRLLPHVEPAALSAANMRKAEKTYSGKRGLLRILEYATGISEGLELVGRLRCLSQLTGFLVERSKLRGSRAARFQVGPDWQQQGLYRIGAAGADGLRIVHTGTNQEVLISWSSVPAAPSLDQLAIQNNWSEGEACLTAPNTSESDILVLSTYFPVQTVDGEVLVTPAKTGAKRTLMKTPSDEHPLKRQATASFEAEVETKASPSHGSDAASGNGGEVKAEPEVAEQELAESAVVPPPPSE
eukprot:5880998-Amphidinium_carterae.4